MRREVRAEPDLDAVAGDWAQSTNGKGATSPPVKVPDVLSVAELFRMEFPVPEMLIQDVTPMRGASLIVGSAKSGKTILAVQMAIAVASGKAFLEQYRTLKQGAALIVEQDDPAGAGTIKNILQKAGATPELPLHVAPPLPFNFGSALLDWIEQQISSLHLQLIVLDSYTSLRGARTAGIDIVKAEQNELRQLDDVAKRLGCAIEIIHHDSKGSAALNWSEKAAGTFAMSAATEAQIHVSRFNDLDSAAPERLIRIRGRHFSDLEMVLRFRTETLDYGHVLEGGAATMYPLLLQIRSALGTHKFGPKEFSHATGVSRATAHRQIERLYRAEALRKCGYGEYEVC